jgi:pyridoxine 5-phosphate synthase
MVSNLCLGVNIDHVATLRQARYRLSPNDPYAEPSLVEAAQVALSSGAHSITIHLRADRRHIQDDDLVQLRAAGIRPINLEMGNTPEIVDIAMRYQPQDVCIVPEHREEVTTEGGLDVVKYYDSLAPTVAMMEGKGIKVSMFIDAEEDQVRAAAKLGASKIELHTGQFANALKGQRKEISKKLAESAALGHQLGLVVNAGHGLTALNLPELWSVPYLHELNIGHSIIARSVFVGLKQSITEILEVMSQYQGGEI